MNLAFLTPFIPEIIVTIFAVFVLISGLYGTIAKSSWWVAITGLFGSITYLLYNNADINASSIIGIKIVILFLSILVLMFYGGMTRDKVWEYGHHEFVFLIMLATIGALFTVSAKSFMILFIALELMALSSYVLAAYERDSIFSSEAGMKYFVLGSLASCIMIFGISLIYGFSGTLSYIKIASLINEGLYSPGLIAGIFVMLIGVLFKLSIAPFHFWTPDIYQGAPFISVAFFTSIPKFATTFAMINIINTVLLSISHLWVEFFIILSIISMVVGGFGAIMQTSFKRLMGYSTVLNSGFVLLALALGKQEGFTAALFYQFIYSIASIGLFASLAITIVPDAEDYPINALTGFGTVKKLAAFSISVFMFSLIGIPPLAGFFAKFYVISAAINSGHYTASIVALIISVVAAYYYLNIIRVMYFVQPLERQVRLHESSALSFVIAICTAITLVFGFC